MKVGDLVIVPYDSWEDEFAVVGDRGEIRRVDVGEVGVIVKGCELPFPELVAKGYWHVHFTEQGSLWVQEIHLEVANAGR